MELDNLKSAFDLQELLTVENEETESISRGVFAFKGAVTKSSTKPYALDSPLHARKGMKNLAKSPRKKSKQMELIEDNQTKAGEFERFHAATEILGNDVDSKKRFSNYIKIEKEAVAVMKVLQSENYSEIIDQVVNFVGKFNLHIKEEIDDATEKSRVSSGEYVCESVSLFTQYVSSSEIPTAALLTGINVPDHSDFFRLLSKQIRSKGVSPHVASIQAKVCGNNLRQLMKNVVCQLMGTYKDMKQECNLSEENIARDDGEEDDSWKDCKKTIKHSNSLASLKIWYDNQYPSLSAKQSSGNIVRNNLPKHTSQNSDDRPPLIIILEDFESFTPKTLQEFIRNLSLLSDRAYGFNEMSRKLRFILIFGIATTVDIIHRTLPHSITSQLAIEKFAAQPSICLLSKVVEQVLVKNPSISFKLHGSILSQMLEAFLFHDFSVKHFLMAYKFCLLQHFSQSFCSILCLNSNDEIQMTLESMTQKDLTVFSRLPSMKAVLQKKAVDKTEEAELKKEKGKEYSDAKSFWKKIQTDDKFFKSYILNNIIETKKATETFNIFVDALYTISSDLPGQPLGKYYHSVYNLAMNEPIQRNNRYRDAFTYFSLFEKSGLLKILNEFTACLKPFLHNKEANEVYCSLQKYKDELENLDKLISPIKDEKELDAMKSTTSSPVLGTIKGKLDRSKWQEALREQAKEKEKKRPNLNPFEAIRKRINDFLNSTFTRILSLDNNDSTGFHPMNQTFHEVFYFKDDQTVNGTQGSPLTFIDERLHGAPRYALQNALDSPKSYLKSLSQLDDESEMFDPDLCIAYKLYLENGRYINLFDWLCCWITIVTNGAEEHAPDLKNKMKVDPKLQARFSRCISELQFLGYIRPSKRKTDHVEKLTWN